MVIKGNDGIRLVAVEHIEHHRRVGVGELQVDTGIVAVKIRIVAKEHILTDGIRRHEMDVARRHLRFFTGRLEPVSDWPEKPVAAYKADFGEDQ